MTWPKGYKPPTSQDNSPKIDENGKICRECNNNNPSNSRFCNQCGTMLSLSCSNCRNSNNSSDASFCNQCGFKLSILRNAPPQRLSLP